MPLSNDEAWFVVISNGDGASTRTVKGLNAAADILIGLVAGNEDERQAWRKSIFDFDGSWGSHYPDYVPWNYEASLEDGSLSIQRLSDDDPIVAILENANPK